MAKARLLGNRAENLCPVAIQHENPTFAAYRLKKVGKSLQITFRVTFARASLGDIKNVGTHKRNAP
ncbi:hypothetical protein ACFPT7_02735 [Acidicapsa dinghuensis]|uniref:Uncharacterized protein n=1 Tax=Acidicapsa dinghuensis TaxID=2218256 RepID=A0ABW1ECT7_9BACT|nr:hypothetical protein [Acidicapsa dinghuensis]